MDMEVGDTFDYETEIVPSSSSYQTTSWTSTDPTIVSVDQTGHIEALSPGIVTISSILTNGLGRDITVSREVKVLIPITGFDVTETNATLYVGDSNLDNITLTPVITPTGYEVDDTIEWTSSDTDIATVEDGKVTGVSNGTVTISARLTHYENTFIDTVTIEVLTLAQEFNITNQDENVTKEIDINEEFTYTTSIIPISSSYSSISWISSDPNVATIDSNGKVTGVTPGTTTITATLSNGPANSLIVTRTIKVLKPITGFDVTETNIDLYYGDANLDHTTLHPVITPAGYEVDDTILWTSSDNDVVTVNNGVITAGTIEGTATITARLTHYGDTFIDTVTVNVYVLAQEFNITNQEENEELELEVDEEFEYETEIIPSNSTYTSITWTSSDQNVATIDSNGKVTGVTPGTTTITATLTNGTVNTISITRTVKVLKPITGFDVTETTATLYVGDSNLDNITLTPVITPTGYEVDDTIEWTSSDTDIATVEDGKVTGVSNGTVTISARLTHYENTFIDTVTIEVLTLTQEFNITNQASNVTKNLNVGEEFEYEYEIVPSSSSYDAITWSTGDSNILTVDQTGKVTAVSPGTTLVTATINNGPANPIIVTRQVKVLVPISSFNIVEQNVSLTANVDSEKTATLTTELLPVGYEADDTIEWSTSDADVATIEDGVITATGPGTATITGTLPNGLSDTVEVTVSVVIEQFVLETPSSVNVELGLTYETRTSYAPQNTTESTTVVWTSDDPTIATVDANGVITGQTLGQTIVRGRLGTFEVTVNVNVRIGISSFTIDQDSVSLTKNQTAELTATITPSNTTEDKTITWTSSDDSIASVVNGVITANAVGSVTITGTLPNGMHVTCEVTVITAIDSFTISPKTATINMNNDNKQVSLSYEILPANAEEDKTITWTSSDDSIASVIDGVVTGEGNGTATITATLPNGMTDTATITVITPVTEFNVTNGISHELNVGQTHTIETEVLPLTTSETTDITWTSSDPTIATVSNGVVTAYNFGTTTIIGTLPNNMTVTVTIKVIKPINNLTLSKNTLSLYIGDSNRDHETLGVIIDPPDTDEDKTVTWTTTNPSIVTVDQTGLVTAVEKGSATITATLANGMNAECVVTVYKPITSFTVNGDTTITLAKGKNKTISTTITPDDTTDNKKITWKSNKTSVATVTSDGKITATNGGTAIITGSLANGMKVTITVNVTVPITAFSIGPASIDLLPGEVKELTPKITPANTTEDTTITWSTTDSSVATVVDGEVTAISLGQATIKATLPNGKKASILINVTLTPRTRMRGDFNEDGIVDVEDVIIALRKSFGYEEIYPEVDYEIGDIDYNGVIEVDDVIAILQYAFGYIDEL